MNLYAMSALLAATSDLIIGSFVLIKGFRSRQNVAYWLMSLSIGLWAFGCFGQSYFLFDSDSAYFYDKLIYTGAILAPLIYLYLITVVLDRVRQYRYFFIVFLLIACSFLVINWVDSLRSIFVLNIDDRYGFRFLAVPGKIWYFFFVYYSFVSSFVLWELLRKFRNAVSGELHRVQYFFLATSFLALGGYMYLFLVLDVYIPQVDNIFHISYSIIMAYAITKLNLMDIRVVVSRYSAYLVVGALSVFSFLFVFLSSNSTIEKLFLLIPMILCFTFFGEKIREKIQTSAERLWLSDWYDREEVLNCLSDALVDLYDREEIFKAVSKVLISELQLRQLTFLMAVPNKKGENVHFEVYHNGHFRGQSMASSDFFISAVLDGEVRPFKSLDRGARESFLNLGVEKPLVLIPFMSKHSLEGVFLLGKRDSEAPYSSGDFQLFYTVQRIVRAYLERMRPLETVREEFNASERQFFRSQKIEAMTRMIREYNHEIKTPLSIIKNRISRYNLEMDLSELKDVVIAQIDRAIDIVQGSLALSETQKNRQEELLQLDDLLARAFELVPDSIRLEQSLNLSSSFQCVEADMYTVFSNLINNAVEAMEAGGVLTVKSYEDDTYLYIEFLDTGQGIAADRLEAIWEPFASGHRTKGRGLGLSIVHRIVREHLGEIRVQSILGDGSRFLLTFKKPF